jgi:hypothetical protein
MEVRPGSTGGTGVSLGAGDIVMLKVPVHLVITDVRSDGTYTVRQVKSLPETVVTEQIEIVKSLDVKIGDVVKGSSSTYSWGNPNQIRVAEICDTYLSGLPAKINGEPNKRKTAHSQHVQRLCITDIWRNGKKIK